MSAFYADGRQLGIDNIHVVVDAEENTRLLRMGSAVLCFIY